MKPTLRAIRAIAAAFISRSVWPLLVAAICAALLLTGVAVWLTTISPWWWILLAPLALVTFLLILAAAGVTVALRIIGTRQNREQRRAVRAYADQLDRLRGTIEAPYPLIIVQVVLDMVRPRPDGFISTTTNDSKTLLSGFTEVAQAFKDKP